MRVLHLLRSDRFSGAENVVCQIISMCKDEKIEFSYSSQDGQIREALRERGIDFHPVKKMSVSEFKRVIKEVQPDVIHAHDMGASFFAALACKKIPLISHIHNNAFDSRGVSLKSLLYYFAARKAKRIFWVSQSSFDGYAFHKAFVEKSVVLYNVIDAEALEAKMAQDANRYDYDVVYLGRLTEQKNPQRLIEVLSKVVAKRPGTKVAIIGTGDLESEIKRLVAEKGLSDNIAFLGFQSNPTKILHDAKVMVMTSRWEGTPMCALEAMAFGVPLVSTPTDGLRELVDDGKTGFLSDDDEVLAQKIVDIITDGEIHSALSRNTREKALIINDIMAYKKAMIAAYTCNQSL